MDVTRGELVEKELDAMIERRSRQKDPDEEHELWRSSVTAYNARRSEELRAAWCESTTRGRSRATGPFSGGPNSPPRGRSGEADAVSARRRLKVLEARTLPSPGAPEAEPSDARRRMVEHLDRLAALRRGELGPVEAAEVEARNAAIEARLGQVRGEGGR
jgi:hypothetical protein